LSYGGMVALLQKFVAFTAFTRFDELNGLK